jgi:hypothetical protein
MNATPDSPLLPDTEAGTPDAAEVVAKPARRPRAPKVVLDAGAPVEAGGPVASDDMPAAVTEPLPKPRRRRAVPVSAEGDVASSEPPSDAPAEVSMSADLQPAPRVEARVGADNEGQRDAQAEQGETSSEVQVEASSESQGESHGESQAQIPGEGQRSRRRNRRDRKRGDRGEMNADQADRPAGSTDPSAAVAAAAQQAGEVRRSCPAASMSKAKKSRPPRPMQKHPSVCSPRNPKRRSSTRFWRKPASARGATWKS